MRYIEYNEMFSRREVIATDVLDCTTFRRSAEIAYPLYADIQPNETVYTGYSAEHVTAPNESGLYELWHITLGGSHLRWEFRKQ